MKDNPSPKGGNGQDKRDDKGRFAPGHCGGPGNPHAQRVAKLRSALLEAVSEEMIASIIGRLVEMALGGNIIAAREILDRCLGKPLEADILEQIEALEQRLEGLGQ